MKKLISKYSKWISDNIDFGKTSTYATVHIEEFETLFLERNELPIIELADFLSTLCAGSYGEINEPIFLILVAELRNKDPKIDWVEMEINGEGTDTTLTLKDYLTPPSLYLSQDILDAILFGNPNINKIGKFGDVSAFLKTGKTENTDFVASEFTTLNFVTKLN